MLNTKLTPMALVLTLCALSPVMLSTAAAAATVQEETTMAPEKSISPREEEVISSAGAKVLRHIAQARADIHNKDADGAKQELDKSEKLLDIIEAGLPTSKIKDRIWVAKKHLEYEDSEEVLPDLVPIYTSLDELLDIMPTDIAKKHLDQARSQLKSGDKEKANEALEATAEALLYTEVDLPLSTTRQLVTQARMDLNKKSMDEADKTLRSVEDSVVYLSSAFEQPLFTAKALLWQTVLDLDAGNKDLAKSDLQGAIGYLDAANQSDDKATREATRQILAQAKALQVEMDGGRDVGPRIHRLWERTHALAERSIEYMTAGWARYRSDSPVKSSLIEAKLHVANARIDLSDGDEVHNAQDELSAAGRYLDKAADVTRKHQEARVDPEKITRLQQAVKDIAKQPAAGQISKLETLQQQLRNLIRTL